MPHSQNGNLMTAQEYSDLLINFDPKSEDQRKAFEKITYRYPYFQSAYAHYLKTLKAQEQYNYDLILRKTAVLSPERETLHHWLEKDLEKEANLPLQVVHSEKKDTLSVDSNIIEPTEDKKEQIKVTVQPIQQEEAIKKAKPKKKKMPVAMTYAEWVVYSSKGQIAPEEKNSTLDEKIALIDTFLENRPKITREKQDQPKVDLSVNNEFNKEELMTETLAKVYLQQKKFKKALYAYQILSLKYPEKNSFFADQIKKIKQLQQKS